MEGIIQGYQEGHYNKNLKEKALWDDPEQDVSAKYWMTTIKEERAGKKPKKERLRGRKKKLESLCPLTRIKQKQLLGDEKGWHV
jgi:hypothetical protein